MPATTTPATHYVAQHKNPGKTAANMNVPARCWTHRTGTNRPTRHDRDGGLGASITRQATTPCTGLPDRKADTMSTPSAGTDISWAFTLLPNSGRRPSPMGDTLSFHIMWAAIEYEQQNEEIADTPGAPAAFAALTQIVMYEENTPAILNAMVNSWAATFEHAGTLDPELAAEAVDHYYATRTTSQAIHISDVIRYMKRNGGDA